VTAYETAKRAYDAKTKPRGSLGRLEELGCRLAEIRGFIPRTLEAVIVVAAADHGVAAEGVSAYPQEVTAQMVANFAAGGAAINVLAREGGARLVVVDAGVGAPTANIARGPAMTRSAAEAQIAAGRAAAAELVADGIGLIGVGDMGIGNTTSAAALCAALLPAAPGAVCGPGTGLDADGVARKAAAVTRALEVNRATAADPLGVLAALGGFEIALLVGVMLGCREARVPVVLDGFITGAAALVAQRLAPASAGALIAAHRSAERGHAPLLEALGLDPVLELDLRLGEGSGAALVLPLLASALALLRDMATFESAGVTDSGR